MPVISTRRIRVRKNKNSPWKDIPVAASKNSGGGGGMYFEPGNALELTDDGVLNVKTADKAEEDNTLPITSAAVAESVGNIEILLGTI